MSHRLLRFAPLLCFVLVSCNCDDDESPPANTNSMANNASNNAPNNSSNNNPNNNNMDAGMDVPDDSSNNADNNTGDDVPVDIGPRPDPGEPVEVELEQYLADEPNPDGEVRVFVSAQESDLVGGEAATGQVGDYVMENDKVRFVIEADTRAIGACPYGGNIIDGDVRRGEGEEEEDVIGEVCQLLNAGRTMKPDRYDILSDGSDGGPGVLAVTGHLEILDFINVIGLASTFLPIEGFEFAIDPDVELPITVTVYYILRGGDQGVRVVTAFRNDGDEALHFPIAHIIDSGGVVEFFNPTSMRKGFGYDSGFSDIAAINGETMIFLGFRGERSSHMMVQDPVEGLGGLYPASGVYLAISGVAAVVRGVASIATVLLGDPEDVDMVDGFAHVAPGATEEFFYWHLVGDGAMKTMTDVAYTELGLSTGRISGAVADGNGMGVEGLRVSVVTTSDSRTMSQDVTAADGTYSMLVPAGDYQVQIHGDGRMAEPVEVSVDAGDEAVADLEVNDKGTLTVRVKTPSGDATTAKIVVFCDGECEQQLTSNDQDVNFDPQVTNAAATIFTGVSGETSLAVVPGNYRVVASRGPEWSVWPPDAKSTMGQQVTVAAGETVEVEAEIAQVVNSPGVMSVDMHVHAINSPDSPVSKPDRVRTFLAEGVDVLVSTDHAFITDFNPTIADLGASDEVVAVVGTEITTFDYGHYNAFPMDRDPASRNGGAVDWANGPELGLTPAQIFEAVHAQGGERVMQLNHPQSGYLRAFEVDTLRQTTTAQPEKFRLPFVEPDGETGDTGMWDEGFTALEIYNGYSRSRFWTIMRWWLGMISRGFTPTATAVSDTHKRIKDQAGGPRSLVTMGDANDTPATFSPEVFATAVNAGKVIGTNGPTFTVTVSNMDGDSISLGEILDAPAGQTVTVEVALDLPEWIEVNTIDVYTNVPLEDFDHGNEEPSGERIEPQQSVPVDLTDTDLVVAETGTVEHKHWVKTVSFELTSAADAYVILVVSHKGDGPFSMFPILHSDTKPFAFTNPFFIDADGNGYDNPPLAEIPSQKSARRPTAANRTPGDGKHVQAKRPFTRNDLIELLEQLNEHFAH